MTMLHALNELARATNTGTTETLQAVEYLPNYAASNPSVSILYRGSDMQLTVDSDAAYLVCDKARSRAGGYHYMTDHNTDKFNGPVYVMAKVIKNVTAHLYLYSGSQSIYSARVYQSFRIYSRK